MTRWLSFNAIASCLPAHRGRTLWSALALGSLVIGAVVSQAALAQAQDRIYRCQGPNGTPQYQNRGGKGCELVDLPPLNSVPAPRQPAGASTAADAPNRASPATRNSNFPRVEAAAQRDRDGDRQRLLSSELKREQDRLVSLREEFNNGEPERRGDERNYQKYLDRVESLRQEIGRAESSVGSIERELGQARN